jgi:superfamily II DNA or RNA helicase
MLRKMRPQTYMLRKVPIIPEQHVEITYKLEESLEPYVAMEKESYALGIEATNPLSRATRLSQIASGRIRREGKKSVARTGREKQRAYDGLLEQFVENDVKKIVVFTRWLPTFRDIVEVNGKHDYASLLFHGGTTDAEREQRIAEFEETDQPTVFLAQSQTGSMGIDLSSASVAVYYTLPSGLVDWDQTHARIRKWHEKRTLAYYYLLASGTVELGQYLAFKHGLELVEALEKHPELFAEQIRG